MDGAHSLRGSCSDGGKTVLPGVDCQLRPRLSPANSDEDHLTAAPGKVNDNTPARDTVDRDAH